MKRLFAPDPAQVPALDEWRERALELMLRLILLAPLPVIALDALRLLPQGAYMPLVIELLTYGVAVVLLLNRRIAYQWRAAYLLGSNLLYASYILMIAGLVGVGRVYLVADIVAAALLLSRRATLLVWLCAAAALTVSGLAFAGRPLAEILPLAQRLTDPNTLLTNGILTLVMGAVVAFGASSLVSSLAQSLRATRQALAERDQSNAELERRVAERTRALEQAVAALQASEMKFRALFQTLPVGVLVVNEQGQYVEHNQIARTLLALDSADRPVSRAEELIPQLIRPDGSALPLAEYPSVRATRETGPISGLEIGIVQPGTTQPVTWVTTNLVPLDPPLRGAVMAFSDITAYKRAEAELRASEAWLRTILQTAMDGFWVVDLQQRFIDVNEAYCALSGYSRAELLTMRITDVEAIERSEEIDARIRQIVAAGSARFESRHRRKDGSCFDVEVSVSHVAGDGLIVCFLRDITAHKQAERALDRQLAIQAAVARCSQALLQPAPAADDQLRQLADALVAIGGVIDTGHAVIIENFTDPEDGLCARAIAGVSTTEGPFTPSHPASRKTPWHYAPAELRLALAAGQPWGGPPATRLAGHPLLLNATRAAGIRSLQVCPIMVEGAWWGALVLTDTVRAQVWDESELLLLQTATEIIGTAIQRWRTEAELSLQLRYAEALARCSQILLRPVESEAGRQATLDAALTTLRETVGVSRLHIFQPPDQTSGRATLRILADSHVPGIAPYIDPSPEQVLDAPGVMVDALNAGRWFGGPVPGQFPGNPHFQQSLDQNDVQAILMVPIILGGNLWGVLSAADRVQRRDWDEPTVQLLRTAAEMIITFQQSWEVTRTLREREHFIQRVTEATPDIIHVLDLVTKRSVFVNRPFAPQLGYAAEHLTDLSMATIQQLVHPDDFAQVAAYYERLARAADGYVAEAEFRVLTSAGAERWYMSRDLIFARDEAGKPTQILSIAQDITESKLTEQSLAASEARLRALRDALPDLLFVMRADGTFLEFYTPRGQEQLVPPESFLGRTIDAVMPPEVAAMIHGAIARVRETGEMELFEDSITFSQRDRMFEVRIVPITGDELLFVVREITERRRATRELMRAKEAAEAADRAKSTFLAHISHEIRTPLTAIIGMTSLLRDTNLVTRQREYVATIHTGAETLLTIIGNILDFSKIEAGQMDLAVQPFDLRECLSGAMNLVSHEAERKGLALDCVVDPAVPATLAGDRVRLHQVLVNLLGNAVKFTVHGAVTLTASGWPLSTTGYELTIAIRDTGIGIAPDQLAQIFDPFVQADSATIRRIAGTGLGLAISKQLVELMGGRITAESTPGSGSSFTLTLPLTTVHTAPPALPSSAARPDRPSHCPLRVLLAEDNLINQEVLRRLLESLGYTPDVVANGSEALAAVTRQPYDVVLMDIQMPEMDGETATHHIRALEEITQPTIIALTASALRGDRERYLAAGMDDYLSKPVQLEDLRAALERPATRGRSAPAPVPVVPAPVPAPPGEAAADSRLVDWSLLDRLLESIGGTPAQAATLVLELFRGTLSAQMAEITAAIAADDRPLVRILAHKLRGGSRQLGAALLAEHWSELESASQRPGEPLAELLDHVRSIYDETLALLGERLTARST